MGNTKDLIGTIPVLTFPPAAQDFPVSMGLDGILFDGEPFPFATIGTWKLEMGYDRVTTLHVEIAVRFGENEPVA
jgi:hypothetical protein